MTRVALYLRISQDRLKTEEGAEPKRDEMGVDRQRAECLAMLAQRGWTVVEEYVDNDISASSYSKKQRPRYLQMIEDAKAGRFDAVVVWDLDRLLRQPREAEDWIDLNRAHGTNLVTISDSVDLSTENGRLILRLTISVAAHESEHKSSRIKSFNSQRAEEGLPMIGKRAFGWNADRISIRDSEAEQIRWAHQHLIDGGSLHSIARHWNETGVLTSTGKTWVTQQVKMILLRKRNAGLLIRHGEVQEVSNIEAIVTQTQHDAVVAIIKGNIDHRVGRPAVLGWLTGLATCGVCGSPMRPKNVTSRGVRQKYYMCETRVIRAVPDDRRHVAVTATALEAAVKLEVVSAFLSGSSSLITSTDETDLTVLNIRLGEIAAHKQALLDLTMDLDAGVTMGDIRTQLTTLATEQTDLLSRRDDVYASNAQSSMLATARSAIVGTDHEVDWLAAMDVWEALSERYDAQPVETRQQLVSDLLDITIRPGYGAKRIDFTHKVVTSLNEPEIELTSQARLVITDDIEEMAK
jgi:site-specific DNA recombinase